MVNDILCFSEKYTPNLDNQHLVVYQTLSAVLAELYFEKRTVFRKKTFLIGTWTFDLGIESGEKITSWVVVGFMKSDKFDEETRNKSAFDWFLISSAVC